MFRIEFTHPTGKEMAEIAAALGNCDAVSATDVKGGYVLTWSRPGYELKLTFGSQDHTVRAVDSKVGGPASRGLKARLAEEREAADAIAAAAAAPELLRRAVSTHLARWLAPPLEISVDEYGEVIVHANDSEIAAITPTCAWVDGGEFSEIEGDFLRAGEHWARLGAAICPPLQAEDTPLGRALLEHLPDDCWNIFLLSDQYEGPLDVHLLSNGNLSVRNGDAEVAVLAPGWASVSGVKIRGDFLRGDGSHWDRLAARLAYVSRQPRLQAVDTPLGVALLEHLPEQYEAPFDVRPLPDGNLSLRKDDAEIAVLGQARATIYSKKIRGDFLRDGEHWERLAAAIDAAIDGLIPPADPATRAQALLADDGRRQLLIEKTNLAAALSPEAAGNPAVWGFACKRDDFKLAGFQATDFDIESVWEDAEDELSLTLTTTGTASFDFYGGPPTLLAGMPDASGTDPVALAEGSVAARAEILVEFDQDHLRVAFSSVEPISTVQRHVERITVRDRSDDRALRQLFWTLHRP